MVIHLKGNNQRSLNDHFVRLSNKSFIIYDPPASDGVWDVGDREDEDMKYGIEENTGNNRQLDIPLSMMISFASRQTYFINITTEGIRSPI